MSEQRHIDVDTTLFERCVSTEFELDYITLCLSSHVHAVHNTRGLSVFPGQEMLCY